MSATTRIDTLVIGAGQAGIATSEHLTRLNIPHLVVERKRVAEQWRTARWDSLVANGPAWHDRFPGMEIEGVAADGFASKDQMASYFEQYAQRYCGPIRTGVDVRSVTRRRGQHGFLAETSAGEAIEAMRVVVATGPFQEPVIPPIIPASAPVLQMHSAQYRNPGQLPPGGVLVVGAGSSGVQIADELARAGRPTWLSVGPHERPPRAYRGRDFCWWLGVLGEWEKEVRLPGKEHVTIAVSGAQGGRTVDFRRLGQAIALVGSTERWDDGVLCFADDLRRNVAAGDANYLELLDAADRYAEAHGLDLPQEPGAREMLAEPACMSSPALSLDLRAREISAVVWATGYRQDYRWLQAGEFTESGKPVHRRGVAAEPGLYFVGLPWLSRRGSAFIWGVWHDAKYIADQIAIQRNYEAHGQRPAVASPVEVA